MKYRNSSDITFLESEMNCFFLKNLQMIFYLVKEKGYTLEGAKVKLKEKPEQVVQSHDIILRLQAIKEELLKIKNQL